VFDIGFSSIPIECNRTIENLLNHTDNVAKTGMMLCVTGCGGIRGPWKGVSES